MPNEENNHLESIDLKSTPKNLSFLGKGSAYFGIWIMNLVLTTLTLGLYYPWAKASVNKFIWSETELEGNRFVFHGTGTEMFKGFIKVYLIILLVFGVQAYGNISQDFNILMLGTALSTSALVFLVPLAIFGAIRYRLSRTSWRGIFFSFKGKLGDFFKLYFKNLLLSIITFGIYAPWMQNNIRTYLISNSKFGNLRLGYDGKGLDFFVMLVVGYFLTIFTFGIYFPWYVKNIFNFHINNMYLIDENGGKKYMKSTLTGGKAFGVMFTNLLLGILTLGLAFAWIFVRNMQLFINNIQMPEDIDFSNIFQEADDYKDATGEDLADVLDIGIDF